MQEIELKFQIPASALDKLTAELQGLPDGELPPQKLQAAYFDTEDRKLARARAALRVRQEDDDWVQTLKAAGANAMTRLEDNQPVPAFGPSDAIRPDLSRHVDPHVRDALVRDLGWQPNQDPSGAQTGLLLLYRTDMRRLRASVDTFMATPRPAHPGQVEIALDIGEITAGPQHRQLRRPVRELEIELKDGDARAVLDTARSLVRRYGLWLDTQTKAHRGDQLAREAASGQPSPMPPARTRARLNNGIRNTMSPRQAWLACVDAALEQIGACLSEVALYDATLHDPSLPAQPMAADMLDPHPWIKGWATGLRRLARLWRHAPLDIATAPGFTDRLSEMRAQWTTLRPQAARYLDGEAAAGLARSAAPTLLALDVLEVIVACG